MPNRYYGKCRQTIALLGFVTLTSGSLWSQSEPLPSSVPDAKDVFFDNAFEQALVGDRPAWLLPGAGNPPLRIAESSGSNRDTGPPQGWSQWVSRVTLEAEIKSLHVALSSALRSPSHFAGGGSLQVADAFSILASLFLVVDAYDGDVRWKGQASAARQRFSIAADSAQQLDASSYDQARTALADLQELLGGGEIGEASGRPLDRSHLESRAALMRRLQISVEDRLPHWLSDEVKFGRNRPAILHESEMGAVLAELLVQINMPDVEDEEFRKYAQDLRDAAFELGKHVQGDDFRSAAGKLAAIRKTCERCHESYR